MGMASNYGCVTVQKLCNPYTNYKATAEEIWQAVDNIIFLRWPKPS